MAAAAAAAAAAEVDTEEAHNGVSPGARESAPPDSRNVR